MATGVGDRLSWSGHSIVLANSLHRLYAQSSLLDVRLVCDQAHIYAHKAVLAAGSNFFWERLQSLGSGMVELQISSVNLGIPFMPSDLRAIVEYMYCGELLVPHHRMPYVLALVRSLQVFGFQSEPEAQYMIPSEIHYTAEVPSIIEVSTENPNVALEGSLSGVTGLGDHTALPLLTLKNPEQNVMQDPPKYSEPVKLDSNLYTLGSSTNMSFSELCTGQGTEPDVFGTQCSQVKHNVPSVFESSVLEDNSLTFKPQSLESGEVFSKPDRDVVYTGTVLNLTGGPDPSIEVDRGDRAGHRDQRPSSTCILEGDTDDAYNTVMLLEALAGEAAGAPNQGVVDGADSIFLMEDAKMAISPRWIRSRKSIRAESRVRLKVKDSIGGVSLQDTSQRLSLVLPPTSSEDETNITSTKESWMVVLSDSGAGVPLLQSAVGITSLATQPPPHPPQDLSGAHTTAAVQMESASESNQAANSSLATVSATSSLLSQTSCANTLPILTHSPSCNPSSLMNQPAMNAAPLLTQSSLPFTPYIQPSLLSTTILNQPDTLQAHQSLPTIPMQVFSTQSIDPEVPVSYSSSASYSVSPSPVTSQLSFQHVQLHTTGSTSAIIPTDQSCTPPASSLSTSSTSSTVSSQSFITTSFTSTPSVSQSPLSSSADHVNSDSSSTNISAPIILQSSASSNILLTQPTMSAPVFATPSVITAPVLPQPAPNINPVVIHTAHPTVTHLMSTNASIPIQSSIAADFPFVSSQSLPTITTSSSMSHSIPPITTSSSMSHSLPSITTSSSMSHSIPSITTSSSMSHSIPSITTSSTMSHSIPPVTSSSTMSWPSSPDFSSTISSFGEPPIVSLIPSSRITNQEISVSPSSLETDIPCTPINDVPQRTPSADIIAISSTASSAVSHDFPLPSAAICFHPSMETSIPCASPSSITPSSPDAVAEDCHGESGDEDAHECSHCPSAFKTVDKLTVHLWEQHQIGTLAKCQLCDFSNPLQSALVKHAVTHIKKENNVCAVCKKNFKTRATMKTHLRVHQGEEEMYKCDSCPMMYSQRFNLIKHMASKHQRDAEGRPLTEPLTCPYCAFTTLAEYKLKAHMVRRHTVDKPYKCNQCTYASTEKPALTKHMRTHTKERPYICETCGFHALSLSSLWRHRRSHTGEKPYECEQCGQQYADSKRLRDHMYKHNNIKPFMCHMCGYTCRRKDNLQTHLRNMHMVEDQKDGVSKSSKGYRQGKSKRSKAANSIKAAENDAPEVTVLSETNQNNTNDVKVKVGQKVSKLQMLEDYSYDSRDESVPSSCREVVGCASGDPVAEQEDPTTEKSYSTTTSTSIPVQTIQSPGPACLGLGGLSSVQLGYLLPVAAPSDPNITLGTLADGVI